MSPSKEQHYNQLYKAGYLSSSFFYHKEMNDKVNSLLATGMTKTGAVRFVADQLGCSTRYIWKSLRQFAELS